VSTHKKKILDFFFISFESSYHLHDLINFIDLTLPFIHGPVIALVFIPRPLPVKPINTAYRSEY
jgi:hypothetical protein